MVFVNDEERNEVERESRLRKRGGRRCTYEEGGRGDDTQGRALLRHWCCVVDHNDNDKSSPLLWSLLVCPALYPSLVSSVMSSEGVVAYSHPSPGVLTRWHVTVGANVEEGALLAEFEGQFDHSCIQVNSLVLFLRSHHPSKTSSDINLPSHNTFMSLCNITFTSFMYPYLCAQNCVHMDI